MEMGMIGGMVGILAGLSAMAWTVWRVARALNSVEVVLAKFDTRLEALSKLNTDIEHLSCRVGALERDVAVLKDRNKR